MFSKVVFFFCLFFLEKVQEVEWRGVMCWRGGCVCVCMCVVGVGIVKGHTQLLD